MGMLAGKVGIITGATSGIGSRTAELFVAEGAAVVFTGRRRREGEALATRLGKAARFVEADAALEADWPRVLNASEAFGGRLDYLFNNAGGPAPTGSITSISVAGFDAAMAQLALGDARHEARGAVLIRQRSGSIIQRVDRRASCRILDVDDPRCGQGRVSTQPKSNRPEQAPAAGRR